MPYYSSFRTHRNKKTHNFIDFTATQMFLSNKERKKERVQTIFTWDWEREWVNRVILSALIACCFDLPDLEAFCIPCHLYAAFCFVLNDTHGTELGLGPVRVLYIVVTPVWHESTDVDVRLLCNAVVEPSLDHVAGDKTRVTFVILTLIPWFLLVLLTFPVPLPCVKKLSIHCFSVR